MFLLLAAAAHGQIAFTGSYTGPNSKGIYAWRFEGGKLTPIGLAAEIANPSFLAVHPNGKFLYAVSEVDRFEGQKAGSVSAYAIEPGGKLKLLNTVSSRGTGPCYVSLDEAGQFAFVANYGGGSVAALPVHADGSLGTASSFVQHRGSGPDKARQEGPHAHAIDVFPAGQGHVVLVPDLGLDQVKIYRFDSARGMLTESDPAFAAVPPGSGPRHIAISADRKFVYAVNEMKSTVTVFQWKAAGRMDAVETVSTLPAGFSGSNSTAEILLHPNGKFLYVSNRGHDSLALFRVDAASGKLQFVSTTPTGGAVPRFFTFDPSGKYLLAANQKSDTITIFAVDGVSGVLKATGDPVKTGAPVCLRFVR